MSDASLCETGRAIDRFWMQPQDLRILDVVRRCYGILLFFNIGLLWIDRRIFFGEGSFLPAVAAAEVVDPDTWNLFSFASERTLVIDTALLLLLASAVALVLGKIPRLAAGICFLLLVAIQHANMMLFDAQDIVFRLFAFYLIFVPPRSQLRLPAASLPRKVELPHPFPAWPLRLFQIQICLIYLCSAIQKSNGPQWLDGTALYYALRLDDATRFHLPEQIVESITWTKFLTWSVLLFEFTVPVLIWLPKARWYCLVTAFLFHLATDYSMNLHLFHWIMMTGLLSFVRYDELCGILEWFRMRRQKAAPRERQRKNR